MDCCIWVVLSRDASANARSLLILLVEFFISLKTSSSAVYYELNEEIKTLIIKVPAKIYLVNEICNYQPSLLGLFMTEDWKPVDSQVLVDAWEEIKDCAEGIQKDLACPDETISKMLRSVAETFDNTVEDLLDKAEEDWEEDK